MFGAITFSCFTKVAGCVDWKQNKLIKGFSQISMPVFLLHQQLIYFSISVMNQLRRDALEKMKEACLKQEMLVENEYHYVPQKSKTSFDFM